MKLVLRKAIMVLVLLAAGAVGAWADDVAKGPKLLLNAQRLRRLKRDRERKTVRWVNFENRVNTVPDSPERGFELALYYAVTGDEGKGREALEWATSHADSFRQRLLVLDWCAPLIAPEEKEKLASLGFVIDGNPHADNDPQSIRDLAFAAILEGRDASVDLKFLRTDIDEFLKVGFQDGQNIYAICELIYAFRAASHRDLREADPHFFSTLPELLLLSAKPGELNSPPWMLHAAALALVAIDPNLPSSQFLQSWALEDSQTLREGPGVAYELLWADPYLPGVGYQNMDTWLYDDAHSRLFVRSSWEPNSCWAAISAKGVEPENCPPNWQNETAVFGHLTLIPMMQRCVDIPHLTNRNESVLVWKLKPHESVTHGKGKEQHASEADAAGIWHPGANIEGRACKAAR